MIVVMVHDDYDDYCDYDVDCTGNNDKINNNKVMIIFQNVHPDPKTNCGPYKPLDRK